jgi:hypothetical protein
MSHQIIKIPVQILRCTLIRCGCDKASTQAPLSTGAVKPSHVWPQNSISSFIVHRFAGSSPLRGFHHAYVKWLCIHNIFDVGCCP